MFHHQKGLLQENVKIILINGRRKRLRQAGSEYTDTKGKIVEAREMKDIDCNNVDLNAR
jgi:hypothetical protein